MHHLLGKMCLGMGEADDLTREISVLDLGDHPLWRARDPRGPTGGGFVREYGRARQALEEMAFLGMRESV
jgi:hypothetical protein